MILRIVGLLFVFHGVVACTAANSCDIKTSGIVLNATVATASTTQPSNAASVVSLRVGSPNSLTYVTLCPQDRLYTEVDNTRYPMAESLFGFYDVTLPNMNYIPPIA